MLALALATAGFAYARRHQWRQPTNGVRDALHGPLDSRTIHLQLPLKRTPQHRTLTGLNSVHLSVVSRSLQHTTWTRIVVYIGARTHVYSAWRRPSNGWYELIVVRDEFCMYYPEDGGIGHECHTTRMLYVGSRNQHRLIDDLNHLNVQLKTVVLLIMTPICN